jgi:CDP-diacylglycerol--serine O-phosphatidyltransferase
VAWWLFCCLFDGRNNIVLAAYFIYIAAVFDFFDGFAARALKASSPVGKELDSLADMVSFGVAPSVILFALLKGSMQVKQFAFSLPTPLVLALLAPFLIALFSAIRLAKFNVDDRQKESFLGLATPACAMVVASIPLIAQFDTKDLLFESLDRNIYFFVGTLFLSSYIVKPEVLIPLSIILSVLLVIEMPMFSLKFKNFSFEDNKLKYIFLFVSILLFSVVQVLSVPIIFILYITFSIFNNLLNRSLSKKAEESLDRLFQD